MSKDKTHTKQLKKISVRGLTFLLSLFLLNACVEKDLDYEYDLNEKAMVIHGMLYQDGIELDIRRLLSPTDQQNWSVLNDVDVDLYEGKSLLFRLDYNSEKKCYQNPENFKAKLNASYHIKAKHDVYGTAVSKAISLPDTTTSHTIVEIENQNKSNFHTIDVYITNQDSLSRFYDVTFINYNNSDLRYIGSDVRSTADFENDTLHYSLDTYFQVNDSCELRVYQLNKSYHDFFKSLEEYQMVVDDPMIDQLPQVVSNIKGARGFIGACHRKIYPL